MAIPDVVQSISCKGEIFEKFKDFGALVTNDVGRAIGALPSDNCGKYVSDKFENYLKTGICNELTSPYKINKMEWWKE